jgi:hypothetical protein
MNGIRRSLAAICLAVAAPAVAQPQPSAQPAAQPAGQPAQVSGPETNDRIVKAEAPIVAGNAVSAKKRALSDAFKQAVEHAFGELLKDGTPLSQPWPPALIQLKASLANAAQKFVRSYRLIEQSSEGGVLKVMVEADVDTVALRREIDRARGTATGTVAPRAASSLVVGGSPSTTPAVLRALSSAGVTAQLGRGATEAQLIADGARQNSHVLFVTESDSDEGVVRGALQVAVKCSLAAHLFMASGPTGRPILDQVEEDRGFGADSRAAREACVERVAAVLARAVSAKLRAPAVGAPFVTLQLDIADPGAIAVVLQACKRVGSVIAAEARQVTATSAEIRVFTRMGGPALQQSLARELAGKLAMVPTQTGNEVLTLRVRNPDSSSLE